MSSVQSIRRAFDVLGTLGDGPLGVTEVADRAGLPKSTAARLLATLVGEGAVEQVPGDTSYRLGPRLITLAGGFSLARSLAAIARPMLDRAGRGVRRGGRPGDARRRPRPLHRPGRHRATRSSCATGPARGRRCTRCRRARSCSRSGRPPRSSATSSGRWSGSPTGTLADPDAVRERLREVRRRGLRVGDRGVRRGDLVGRGADRRRVGRGDRRGPRPRTVVPFPAGGPGG